MGSLYGIFMNILYIISSYNTHTCRLRTQEMLVSSFMHRVCFSFSCLLLEKIFFSQLCKLELPQNNPGGCQNKKRRHNNSNTIIKCYTSAKTLNINILTFLVVRLWLLSLKKDPFFHKEPNSSGNTNGQTDKSNANRKTFKRLFLFRLNQKRQVIP